MLLLLKNDLHPKTEIPAWNVVGFRNHSPIVAATPKMKGKMVPCLIKTTLTREGNFFFLVFLIKFEISSFSYSN